MPLSPYGLVAKFVMRIIYDMDVEKEAEVCSTVDGSVQFYGVDRN